MATMYCNILCTVSDQRVELVLGSNVLQVTPLLLNSNSNDFASLL